MNIINTIQTKIFLKNFFWLVNNGSARNKQHFPWANGDTIKIYERNVDGSEDYKTTIFKNDIDTIITELDGNIFESDSGFVYPTRNILRNIKKPIYNNKVIKQTITINEPYRWLINKRESN